MPNAGIAQTRPVAEPDIGPPRPKAFANHCRQAPGRQQRRQSKSSIWPAAYGSNTGEAGIRQAIGKIIPAGLPAQTDHPTASTGP
ncbi:MAG TPA: hypothetical protein DDY14_09950 [Chromatiaceae bacterium]|nr:hypothetical protein [Chromatiaceae bacterium]